MSPIETPSWGFVEWALSALGGAFVFVVGWAIRVELRLNALAGADPDQAELRADVRELKSARLATAEQIGKLATAESVAKLGDSLREEMGRQFDRMIQILKP